MKQVVLNGVDREEGWFALSVNGDANAGELFPLVGPSCNDKIYEMREELRRDRWGWGGWHRRNVN